MLTAQAGMLPHTLLCILHSLPGHIIFFPLSRMTFLLHLHVPSWPSSWRLGGHVCNRHSSTVKGYHLHIFMHSISLEPHNGSKPFLYFPHKKLWPREAGACVQGWMGSSTSCSSRCCPKIWQGACLVNRKACFSSQHWINRVR